MMLSVSAEDCDLSYITFIALHRLEESVLWSNMFTNCLRFLVILISWFICYRVGEAGLLIGDYFMLSDCTFRMITRSDCLISLYSIGPN